MRAAGLVDDATVVGAVTVEDIQGAMTSSDGSATAPAVRHLTNRAEDPPGRDQGPFQRPALRLTIAGKPSRQCRCIEFEEGPISDDEQLFGGQCCISRLVRRTERADWDDRLVRLSS
jgi:hypothetical protein